jgi:predicted transposase YbfD/YdcC
MNEDDCKIRRGNAAELFSGIRHIAINILTNFMGQSFCGEVFCW